MASSDILLKDPDESRLYDIEFASVLYDGEALSNPAVTATPTGLTIGTPSISGTKVQVRISDGTDGQLYYVRCLVQTTNNNVLDECVRLFVADCSWLPEMVRIVRHLVADLASTPRYTDARLGEVILVAAQNVLAELTFDTTYTINVGNLYLSPNPTADATRDDVFMNLVCLRAACIIDTGELRDKARISGISVKDSMGTITTNASFDGYKALLSTGPCALFAEMKKQYEFGNLRSVLRGIFSPFSSDRIDTSYPSIGYRDNFK
jgi:hypothetical protein